MEFDIDDFKSNGSQEMEIDSDEELDTPLDELDAPLDELDTIFEAGLENGKDSENASSNIEDSEYEEREKVILKVKVSNIFEILPEGWIEVIHKSGMPVYLHKASRVCCVSKPYYIGPGSTRGHEIPLSAIPCLAYLNELEKEKSKEAMENGEQNETFPSAEVESCKDAQETVFLKQDETFPSAEVESGKDVKKTVFLKQDETFPSAEVESGKDTKETGFLKQDETFPSAEVEGGKDVNETGFLKQHETFPPAEVESGKDAKETGFLNYLAVREYCQRRFEFKTITVKRFKSWSDKKEYYRQLKQKKNMPTLPDNTKLITCPLRPISTKSTTNGNKMRKEYVINPSGKTPVSLLHEYVQHSFGVSPKYIFKDRESFDAPFGAVMMINGIEYGSGDGNCKKQAKSEAAKSALNVLIPKMKLFAPEKISDDEEEDYEFFDEVRVEDPRVLELSAKGGQPFPYNILLECVKRCYGMGDTGIKFTMRNIKHQTHEFSMTVGKHTVSVICKTKKDGKHRASQAMLQILHPHINSWGSLLRMYGKGYIKRIQAKKEAQRTVTVLQNQACDDQPNILLINKLKEEMLKHKARMHLKPPIGKLIQERMNVNI